MMRLFREGRPVVSLHFITEFIVGHRTRRIARHIM